VQEGHRHAVPAQRVVAFDLGDLRAEKPGDRGHAESLAHAEPDHKPART
jgi:hypothetical protein